MTDLRKELVHLNLMDTYGCPVHIYVRESDVIKVSKALKLVGFRKITHEDVFYMFKDLEKAEAEGFDYKAIANDPAMKRYESCFYNIYEQEPIIKPYDRDNPTPFIYSEEEEE